MKSRGKQASSANLDAVELIDHIYRAAEDSAHWHEFLVVLLRVTRGLEAAVVFMDPAVPEAEFQTILCRPSGSRESCETFCSTLRQWTYERGLLDPAGSVLVGRQLLSDSESLRTGRKGRASGIPSIERRVGAIVLREGARLSFLTLLLPNAAALARFGRVLLPPLMPHLQRAVGLHCRISALKSQLNANTAALDHWRMGVILLAADGGIFSHNSSARTILGLKDGFSPSRGDRETTPQADVSKLRRLAAAARSTLQGEGAKRIFLPHLRRSVSVVMVPLHTDGVDPKKLPPMSALFITDPETRPEIDREILGQLYRLTEREAEIASLLIHGASVGDVCVKLGIAARTARTHLEALFAKTGAHRQSDLLLLLLSSPAALLFSKKMA